MFSYKGKLYGDVVNALHRGGVEFDYYLIFANTAKINKKYLEIRFYSKRYIIRSEGDHEMMLIEHNDNEFCKKHVNLTYHLIENERRCVDYGALPYEDL